MYYVYNQSFSRKIENYKFKYCKSIWNCKEINLQRFLDTDRSKRSSDITMIFFIFYFPCT